MTATGTRSVPPGSNSFDFSGFRLRIDGLDDACLRVFDNVWGLFAGAGGELVLDLSVRFDGEPLTADRVEAIEHAFHAHSMLLFRGQTLAPTQQIGLMRKFCVIRTPHGVKRLR